MTHAPRLTGDVGLGHKVLRHEGAGDGIVDLKPGVLVGRYQLEELVGSGGFGDVFRASDPLLRRGVAVKIAHARTRASTREDTLAQSLREARAASALNHPSIVVVHDFGECERGPFIVMEWVDGITLRDVLRDGPVPLDQSTAIIGQIATALERAHRDGIVHCDLKPENLMIRHDEVVKILDFGLARQFLASVLSTVNLDDSDATLLASDEIVSVTVDESGAPSTDPSPGRTRGLAGTLRYMSPEQGQRRAPTASSDLFSFGIVIYELLTGQHPFDADSPLESLRRIVRDAPPPPHEIVDLPLELSQATMQLLAKNPLERSRSALAILDTVRSPAPITPASQRSRARADEKTQRMVGRDDERRILDEAWARVCSGTGSAALVEGEPGIGKTTLVEAFTSAIESEPRTLLGIGRSYELAGGGEAYAPFLEALTMLGRSPHAPLIRAAMRAKAPTWFVQLHRDSLDSASLEDLRRQLIGAGPERMRRELGDFVEELSRSFSLCLVLEDLHWIDEASIGLLSYLSQRLPSLRALIVTTYRPSEVELRDDAAGSLLLSLKSKGHTTTIRPRFLTKDHIVEYVGREFAPHRFPEEFAAWLHDRTEGNPLFVFDLLQSMKSSGSIAYQDGWVLAAKLSSLDDDIPAGTEAMVERLLGWLSESDRQVLGAAAIRGEIFDSKLLAEAVGRDEIEIEETLDRLDVVHRLIRPVEEIELPDGSLSIRYRFVHSLYQRFLYSELRATRRTRMHLQVAESMADKEGSAQKRFPPAELALHFDRGRRFSEAAPRYLEAAGVEMTKFAFDLARGFCDKALETAKRTSLDERPSLLASAYTRRGLAKLSMGRLPECIGDFDEAISLAERHDLPLSEMEARQSLLAPLHFTLQRERLEENASALAALGESHDHPQAVFVARFYSIAPHILTGETDKMAATLETLCNDPDAKSFSAVAHLAFGARASLECLLGDYAAAAEHFEEARELTETAGDGFHLLNVSLFDGMAHGNQGDLERARATFEHGHRLATENFERFWIGRFPNCLAWLHYEAFDDAAAFQIGEEAIAAAKSTGLLEPEAHAQINFALAAIRVEYWDVARAALLRGEEIYEQDSVFTWRYRQRLDHAWSELHLMQGRHEEALASAQACCDVSRRTPGGKYLVLGHRQVARARLAVGDLAAAHAALQEAERSAEHTDGMLSRWRLDETWMRFLHAADEKYSASVKRHAVQQALARLASRAPIDLRSSIERYAESVARAAL